MAELCLPLELHQGILEHLRDDISSLSRCALVCSTWRSTVQPWMFATLTVGAQPPPFPRLEEIRTFFAVAPYLGQHVSRLELLGGRAGARLYIKSAFPLHQKERTQEFRIQRVLQQQMRMFRGEDIFQLPLFPHIRTIHFQEGSITSLSHLLYHYPHLHTLSLCRVSFAADLPVAHCEVQNLNVLFTRRNDNSRWPALFQAPYLKHLKVVWEYHTPHIISPPNVRLLRGVLESVPSTLDSICWIICHTGSAYGSSLDPILGEPHNPTVDICDGPSCSGCRVLIFK
jgi:hypothetical protein